MNRRILSSLAQAFSVGLLLMLLCSYRNPNTTSVVFEVVDNKNAELADAQVKMTHQQEGKTFTLTYSASAGGYTTDQELPYGTYRLEVTHPNCANYDWVVWVDSSPLEQTLHMAAKGDTYGVFNGWLRPLCHPPGLIGFRGLEKDVNAVLDVIGRQGSTVARLSRIGDKPQEAYCTYKCSPSTLKREGELLAIIRAKGLVAGPVVTGSSGETSGVLLMNDCVVQFGAGEELKGDSLLTSKLGLTKQPDYSGGIITAYKASPQTGFELVEHLLQVSRQLSGRTQISVSIYNPYQIMSGDRPKN